ncbi:hypothetical protein COCNU_contig69553323G000010 [Cocos nucifera]|nr:hypothetical protein [Cocos nucifera]
MIGAKAQVSDYSEFVEVDPTGRYGRYNEILGRGASKAVYRAFDEYEGIEVAWNQVKLYDFLQSSADLERLYCEIHLLKTLKHKNIMKFYTSWVDTSKRNINFVTEMFTSGTLRHNELVSKILPTLYLDSDLDLAGISILIRHTGIYGPGGDPEVRQFVEKCLATASRRLPARELLKDPFLQLDDHGMVRGERESSDMGCIVRQPSLHLLPSSHANGFSDSFRRETEIENGWDCHGMDLFNSPEDEPVLANVDITIKGRRTEDGDIFLRLRIADEDGRVRNIYFPFDIEADTALSVATEMVAELDITDHEVTRIAETIDGEVAALVPEWKPGPGIEEMPGVVPAISFCQNYPSNVSSCSSLPDYLSLETPGCASVQSIHCSDLERAAMHGRFEDVAYQIEGSEHNVTEGAPVLSTSQSDGLESCSPTSRENFLDDEGRLAQDERVARMNGSIQQHCLEVPELRFDSPPPDISYDYENEIHQELTWLKAKYQTDKTRRLGESRRALHPSPDFGNRGMRVEDGAAGSIVLEHSQTSDHKMIKSFHLGMHFSFHVPRGDAEPITGKKSFLADRNEGYCWSSRPDLADQRARYCEANAESSPDEMFTAKNFYAGAPLPNCVSRTKSLPV